MILDLTEEETAALHHYCLHNISAGERMLEIALTHSLVGNIKAVNEMIKTFTSIRDKIDAERARIYN